MITRLLSIFISVLWIPYCYIWGILKNRRGVGKKVTGKILLYENPENYLKQLNIPKT